MRRTTSIPGHVEEERLLLEGLAEVDCGCCRFSFRKGDPLLPGLASVHIRLHGQQPGSEWLIANLDKVLHLGMDFVVTYDFRNQTPAPKFTEALASFWQERRKELGQQLKSAALLVKDSLFDTAMQNPISGFVQACSSGCPLLVCHGEAAAEEFFRAGARSPPQTEDTTATPFVSVVDVQEALQQGSSGADTSSCIASLAPLQSRGSSAGGYENAHTFHRLPNGDVRVIQSPPGDIVLQGDAWRRQNGGKPQPGEDAVAEPHPVAPNADSAVAALKFECPREQLQQFIGTHFHFGELVIDAEFEAASRSQSRRQSTSSTSTTGTSTPQPVKSDCWCLDGLNSLFVKMLNHIMAMLADDSPSD